MLHASERVSIAARSIRGVLEEREQALVAHVEEVVLPAILLDLPALLLYKLYVQYILYISRCGCVSGQESAGPAGSGDVHE